MNYVFIKHNELRNECCNFNVPSRVMEFSGFNESFFKGLQVGDVLHTDYPLPILGELDIIGKIPFTIYDTQGLIDRGMD